MRVLRETISNTYVLYLEDGTEWDNVMLSLSHVHPDRMPAAPCDECGKQITYPGSFVSGRNFQFHSGCVAHDDSQKYDAKQLHDLADAAK